MFGVRTVLALFAAAVSFACSQDADSTVVVVRPPPEPPRRSAGVDVQELLYDGRGELLESDDVVAGLRLPRGLRAQYTRGRQHEYVSEVPSEKLLSYFGPRLMTGIVDRNGEETVYREATPRNVAGGVVKLDVSIRSVVGGQTVVSIFEIPPTPPTPVSPEEIQRVLVERARTAS